jgi:hypothetical protein
MFGDNEGPFLPHRFDARVRLLPTKEPQAPKVIISRAAYERMWLYVDMAPQEVGWMGTATRLPSGDFEIAKVMLFDQQVSGVETEITTDGFGSLATELIQKGDEGLDDWNKLRFWGHSHVRMGTTASGTDERTMIREKFDRQFGPRNLFCFQDANVPWAIRGIFNKHGRAEFTIFLYEEGLRIDDAEWMVVEQPAKLDATSNGARVVTVPGAREAAGEVSPVASGALNVAGVSDQQPGTGQGPVGAGEPPAVPGGETGVEFVGEVDVPLDETTTAEKKNDVAVDEATPETGKAAAGEDREPSQTAEEDEDCYPPRVKKAENSFVSFIFSKPKRDPRYTVSDSSDLRREVSEEMRRKVRSRGWFGGSPCRLPTQPPQVKLKDPAPLLRTEVEGEASGPGTTGRLRSAFDARERELSAQRHLAGSGDSKDAATIVESTKPASSLQSASEKKEQWPDPHNGMSGHAQNCYCEGCWIRRSRSYERKEPSAFWTLIRRMFWF